jgi:hypothetical protein
MKKFLHWFFVDNPFGFVLGLVFITATMISASVWISVGERMAQAHLEFLRRQEVCAVQGGWYEREDNYHGLMACYDLGTHELFYVVPETGLALVPRQ